MKPMTLTKSSKLTAAVTAAALPQRWTWVGFIYGLGWGRVEFFWQLSWVGLGSTTLDGLGPTTA